MDCRNPEARDGFHADWMPSFPDGMTLTTALKVDRSPNQDTFLTKQLLSHLSRTGHVALFREVFEHRTHVACGNQPFNIVLSETLQKI
ncbi:hypothetical protein MGMO_49c00140 [Methyloglobulus morosus KoM1]|uniref:Uncharacterized protein n=1 Tax=Methyloglobulus morosus KoM1 TaxID=1116472 RepID=V5BY08_9GAMM|nr:hypothetical protein [Methyloglobulus morosus]ESS72729.1 hypothetical protein MGMO_49c00140 [Methyloglobulus morosus KoM1]